MKYSIVAFSNAAGMGYGVARDLDAEEADRQLEAFRAVSRGNVQFRVGLEQPWEDYAGPLPCKEAIHVDFRADPVVLAQSTLDFEACSECGAMW